MARTDTYAFVRPCPYLLQRALTQSVYAPIRWGSGGGLVTPTAGTFQLVGPDGSDIVAAVAVTGLGPPAYYQVTAAALPSTLALGSGYTAIWALTMGGEVYTYRQSVYLCEYVPPNVVSEHELYVRIPELRMRVPQAQGDNGDGTGWQPQIDDAYYWLLQRLIDDARRPWAIREVSGYREVLLVKALQTCVGALTYGPESSWAQAEKRLAFDLQRAMSAFRIQYDDDAPGTRRGGSPVTRLCPVGRPMW